MDSIIKYFPAITDEQRHQYEQLFELYKDWNSKINVISRKDIDISMSIMCSIRLLLLRLCASRMALR